MRERRAVWLYASLVLACAALLAGCATGPTADDERAAAANAGLGADFLRQNNNEQALSRFKRALRYDDDNLTANWGMAVASDRVGEVDDARHYYERTLELAPGGNVFNSYATFLCKQGEVERAVKYFERAANDPRYGGQADALANAGLCLHRAGQAEAAEAYHRKALSKNAGQATALMDMARLMYEQGDYLRARAFNERADAAAEMDADQLLLGARIELALGDRRAAGAYLERHNARKPSATMSLRQLEQSRR